MDLGISNRVALVLGAGGGLGRAIAVSLAGEGARLAIADINAKALEDTADAVTAFGPKGHQQNVVAHAFDLSNLDAIDAQIGMIENELGPVDILINNTGGPPPSPAAGQDSAAWRRAFDTMVAPIIAITDRVLPGMRERGWGRIVTSTSSGVIAPIPNLAFSNALRATLVGWSKTLASEVARDGVTVNIIVPGRIATGRTQFLDQAKAGRQGRDLEEVVRESSLSIPTGRYGRPEEYADTVAYLASNRASYITGSVVRVDGGLLANL